MKNFKKVMLAPAVVALASIPGAAYAAPGDPPDLTPISDAVVSGLTQGITVLLALAPIVILFAVVMGIIRKARTFAK